MRPTIGTGMNPFGRGDAPVARMTSPDCRIGVKVTVAEIAPCCGLASLSEARSATIGT
jgi:hypothetical protein